MQQRARATLPGRRRTCHGTVPAALQLLLVQQSLWEPRTGTGRRHRGPARVTPNINRVGAYGRADGLSRFGDGARRRAATAGGDAEVLVFWTTRCLRLLAAVSHRVL